LPVSGSQGFALTARTTRVCQKLVRLIDAVCRQAAWLGVDLDPAANAAGGPRFSTASSRVAVWVILTNEELMIARHTRALAV
jgi:acetate kinase